MPAKLAFLTLFLYDCEVYRYCRVIAAPPRSTYF